MKKKNNRVIVFALLVGSSILTCLISNPVLNFFNAALVFIFIVVTAKLSFFTEVSFILLFSYLQGVIHKVTGGISGSTLAWAGVKMPFYFDDLTIATFSFLLTAYWFVNFTEILEREKRIYNSNLKIGKLTGVVFVLLAFILGLMIFPSMPSLTFSEGSRARNESLPYGLVLLSFVLLGISFDTLKRNKWLGAIYVFMIFWVFGHGERVEVLGFLSYLALKYIGKMHFSSIKQKTIKNKKKLIYIAGFFVALLAMWIGIKRGGNTTISFTMLLYNLFVQPTCGDVVYCFNCAADLWHTGGGLLGYTYIDYLVQLIPGSTSMFSPAVILLDKFNTMGGALFYSESMMNFGIAGVIIFNIEFFIIMNFLLKKSTTLRSWMWVPIVTEVFRICWYGRSGWILTAFAEVPLLYMFSKYILNRIKV